MWHRRQVLGLIGAAALPALPAAAMPRRSLTARAGMARLAPADMPETAIWGYDALVPGPELRVKQGGRVTVDFVNALDQPSTVHWHGIRIANAMDGVPGLTQEAVAPGASFTYDFTAPDAGTYWYHSHERSWEQMARGLYGPLIVEEAEPPEVDRDLTVMLDDWRLTQEAAIDQASFGAMHDRAHAGRIGNWVTANGDGEAVEPVRRHERLRLRLCNAANARVFELALNGLAGWVIALDGQPVPPELVTGLLTLAPAQRIELIVDVTAGEGTEAALAVTERDGAYAAVLYPVDGSARAEPLPAPAALPPNPVAPPGDLAGALAADLVMEGGAMGNMAAAMHGGRRMEIRDLVAEGYAWAFNGTAGIPEAPLVEAALGQTVRLKMVNSTAWPHAMHLHGHHFQEVTGGRAQGPLRDTLLVGRSQTVEIAFLADNPGDWMLHCHMLEHAAAGMMTWLRVT
ncbi:MAG TPA: multicopper oxidase family protein [Thermohalobaculum sp.]|nr:multicopper oxidase family protein [Thermohalobaculum sp.]